MPSRVFIHATNVHQGGGRSLLDALLRALPGKPEIVLILDSRMLTPKGIANNIQIKRVEPSVHQRLGAELWLARNVAQQDTVLCFGNLPPLIGLRGYAIVFVQNRYLIDSAKLTGFPLKVRLRLAIERVWLSGRSSNADEFIVQTPTMKTLLETKVSKKALVRILPFVAEPMGYKRGVQQSRAQQKNNDYDFVYVASGEAHKNHLRLIEAWCLLAGEGLFPSLCLTLEETRFAELCTKIESMSQHHGLRITNAGFMPHQDALALYKRAGAAIYPSAFESFGLPLIEARQAGLPILAAELDYVRDMLDPEQTFDPQSSLSIARAVKRFMGIEEAPLPLQDAKEFLEKVIGKVE